jgi:LuxR family maltose regulon positive regulatory protein
VALGIARGRSLHPRQPLTASPLVPGGGPFVRAGRVSLSVGETVAASQGHNRPLFRRHVRRPRLTGVLDRAEAQAIVLLAPAGYGKTVLAAEWTQGRPNVAWYRATAASVDLAAFSLGLCSVLRPVVPGAGERLEARVAVGAPAEARTFAELLAEDLTTWPRDGLLVIDDYHLPAEAPGVDELVESVFTLSPLRLLVTTRVRPAWATARRILHGHVTEIGRDQLAMTWPEAEGVLAGHPPRAVRKALSQAEGWPALIGLAAIAAESDLPERAADETRYRYLAEEVLRCQPPEVQEFMLAACIPLAIDERLARDVLGVTGAGAVIDQLLENGLLQPLDGRSAFHPLLRDFLRQKLATADPDEASALARRAADDAVARDRPDEAFEIALEHGDREHACEIAAASATRLLVGGRIGTVERWLDVCGPAAMRRTPLAVARAAIALRRGELDDAAAVASEIAARVPASDPHASRASYIAAQALHLRGEREQALEHATRAAETAQKPEDLMDALLLATLAAAALEVDDWEYLGRLEKLAIEDERARVRLGSALYWSGLRRPTLAGAWERLSPLLALAEESGPMLKSEIVGGAAYVNVLRGEYELAEELAARAVATAADFKLRVPHIYCLLYLAHAQIGRRELAAADQTLQAAAVGDLAESHAIRLALDNARLKRALASGGPVPSALDEELFARGTSRRSRSLNLALRAVALAREGDVEGCRRSAEAARAASGGVEAAFYSRWAELAARVDSAGDDEVAQLLDETVRSDILDAFVVAYRAQPELLAAAGRRRPDLVGAVLAAAHDLALAPHAGIAPDHGAADDSGARLTHREAEVLALLMDGLSNSEIAQRLFISENTAKVHVHHVLEKLGAKTRAEAIAKARRGE